MPIGPFVSKNRLHTTVKDNHNNTNNSNGDNDDKHDYYLWGVVLSYNLRVIHNNTNRSNRLMINDNDDKINLPLKRLKRCF